MAIDPNQLRSLLARIARIVEQSAGKRRADGLRAIADALSEENASSAIDAINRVRARLSVYAGSKKRSPPLPTLTVDEYLQQLRGVQQEADLTKILQGFRAKNFKKAQLDEIAHRFAKGPASYKSKAEAIKDIERSIAQRKRAANELEYLERKKVTPW